MELLLAAAVILYPRRRRKSPSRSIRLHTHPATLATSLETIVSPSGFSIHFSPFLSPLPSVSLPRGYIAASSSSSSCFGNRRKRGEGGGGQEERGKINRFPHTPPGWRQVSRFPPSLQAPQPSFFPLRPVPPLYRRVYGMRFIPTSYHTCMQPRGRRAPPAASLPPLLLFLSASLSRYYARKEGEAKKEVLYMHENGKKGGLEEKAKAAPFFLFPPPCTAQCTFFSSYPAKTTRRRRPSPSLPPCVSPPLSSSLFSHACVSQPQSPFPFLF